MMMKEGHDLGLKQALDIQTATAYFTTWETKSLKGLVVYTMAEPIVADRTDGTLVFWFQTYQYI